jgi:hypothetical protein
MQREAEQEVRKRLSTVENMPFLDIEDALLEARRASSLTLYITSWFTECYEFYFKKHHTHILREYILLRCNDFS